MHANRYALETIFVLSVQCQLIVNEDFKPSILSHSSFPVRIAKDVAGNKQLVQKIKTTFGILLFKQLLISLLLEYSELKFLNF
jgi:hypothetical protein